MSNGKCGSTNLNTDTTDSTQPTGEDVRLMKSHSLDTTLLSAQQMNKHAQQKLLLEKNQSLSNQLITKQI